MFVLEHSGFHHWKENYLIRLPYEYHAEEHTGGPGTQFSHKKREKRSKTYFDFFPISFPKIRLFFYLSST